MSAYLTDAEQVFLNHQGGGPIWRVRLASEWPVAVGLVRKALVEVDRPITAEAPEHSFEARIIVYERTERVRVHAVMLAMAQSMESGIPAYTNSIYRRVCNIIEAIDAADPAGPALGVLHP